MRFDTLADFDAWLAENMPGASRYEDLEGQIIIYTGLSNDGPNGVIPTSETY